MVDPSGEKINNVRVVLDLDSTEDDEEDYVVRSAINEGDEGVTIFENITWRDPDSTDSIETTTETAVLFIDDVNYRLDYSSIDSADLFSDAEADDLGRDYGIKLSFTADQSQTLDPVTIIPVQFTTQSVTWRIIQSGTSSGINGVRVVLDLNTDGTVDEDYVAVTATDPSTGAGTYTFNNINWENRAATGTTDTRDVIIRVVDDSYEDAELPAMELTSGPNTNIEASNLIVTHVPRTEFSTDIEGRIINREGEIDFPMQGIEVKVTFTDDSGDKTLYTTTDVNGVYSFLIEWTEGASSAEADINITIDIDSTDSTLGNPGTNPSDITAEDFINYNIRSEEDLQYIPDVIG